MEVYLLTTEQKKSLIGQHYKEDCLFNPIQDADNNWIITSQEVKNCTNNTFLWVELLPTIQYKQKIFNPFQF
jgi:hypothetical protein